MLKPRHITLSDFDHQNPHLLELYEIFSETLNKNLTYREFHFFFCHHHPHQMDISFLMDGNRTAGFICVTFYRHRLENKMYTICRGAAGIHENYRGGMLPSWLLCRKYIQYWLKHPFEKMYVIGFMANPILYSMICKYTHKVYPKIGLRVPAHILTLRDNLINYYGLQKKIIGPFILKIHFQVCMNELDEKRVFNTKDKDIVYYLEVNSDFQKQIGLMTIVPVTWHNVLVSCVRGLVTKPLNKLIRKHFTGLFVGWKIRVKSFGLPHKSLIGD